MAKRTTPRSFGWRLHAFLILSLAGAQTVEATRRHPQSWISTLSARMSVHHDGADATRTAPHQRMTKHRLQNRQHEQSMLMALRGGGSTSDYESLVEGAYEWCVDLGAPSALVAGAVVATLYESMHNSDMEVSESDTKIVQLAKKMTRLLLVSAFAMEAISIFVTTVTGTMLLSVPISEVRLSSVPVHTPLQFLRANYEFEYLTARVTFLQGLLNWLAAIGLSHLFPSATDSPSTIALNKFIACSMGTVIVMMISFYNTHMTFYHNYPHMLSRWAIVTLGRFYGVKGKPHPLLLLMWPFLGASFYFGHQALSSAEEDPVVTIRKKDSPVSRSVVESSSGLPSLNPLKSTKTKSQ